MERDLSQSTINGGAPASPAALVRADKAGTVRPAPELTIVVPTFNEQANIPILFARLNRVLASHDWEVIFVDDNSPDGSATTARSIGEADSRVRCIRRIGRRGLACAPAGPMLSSPAATLTAALPTACRSSAPA
jgi:dolichol-phosphate mannosyltransferase